MRATDQRRLDLIVPGLNVDRGLPLFCDITVVSPITRSGFARAGTSNRGGALLETAERTNDATYHEVSYSGLGSLQCLGCEVYGRWSKQCVELVPKLARERARGLHVRVRRGSQLMFQRRWWGILCVALQQAVSRMVLHAGDAGADLFISQLEPALGLACLEVV